MRGTVAGLTTPYPIGEYLPAIYLEDSFAQRFTAGLDEVLAPAVAVLDSLEAYVDPALTPTDFLPWLAGWLGLVLEEDVKEDRKRALIAEAALLYAARGTRAGLQAQIDMTLGRGATVVDSGRVLYSDNAGGCPTVRAEAEVIVRLPARAAGLRSALAALVLASKPAHCTHTVEVASHDYLP